MTTWHRGREATVERMRLENLPLGALLKSLCEGSHPPQRVGGTAVFPGGLEDAAPSAFLHNLKHNEVMHRVNIFLVGKTEGVPLVAADRKAVVVPLGYDCYSVTAHHGFMEIPNIPAILELIEKHIPDWQYEPGSTSFFLARNTIVVTGENKFMPVWREKLFALLARNAAPAAEYYSLPANRVVEMGGQINI
jgi:KUP system potassium uptake protein